MIAPSGRIQFDTAAFSQNAASTSQGYEQDAIGFRRARIALLGEYEMVDYIIEMDFANRGPESEFYGKTQSTAFKDVYIQVRDLPVLGNVRVGHFKECFGLEQFTGDNFTTFMERSVCDEGAFVPGRNDGIMAFNWTENERATWAIGAFANATGLDQPPLIQTNDWGAAVTARTTFLPWYDVNSNGRGLLHLGVDYSYRTAYNDLGKFATRPEANFADALINMSLPNVKDWQVVERGSGAGLRTALFAVGSFWHVRRVRQRRHQHLLGHVRLCELLSHRRKPAL